MLVHIFTKENVYSAGLLNLIGKHLDPDQHVFIFRKSGAGFTYPETIRKRIVYAGNLRKLFLSFSALFRRSSQVYFHYLPSGPSLAIWAASPSIVRKSTWVIWGGDIYPLTKNSKSASSYFYEFLRKRVIKNIRHIAAFLREDFDIVAETYSTSARYSQILYPVPLNTGSLNKSVKPVPGHCPAVLLGNSASPTNNHLEALEILSGYKGNEVKIICPLSYGSDTAYSDMVRRKGRELFGDRFVPLDRFIDPEEYAGLLAEVDVAVMNHNRQQGLGNILPVLYLGKKVYLKKESSSYSFLQRMGCTVFDIDEMKTNPGKLFNTEGNDPARNSEIIGELMSEENCVRLWGNLFSQVKEKDAE